MNFFELYMMTLLPLGAYLVDCPTDQSYKYEEKKTAGKSASAYPNLWVSADMLVTPESLKSNGSR